MSLYLIEWTPGKRGAQVAGKNQYTISTPWPAVRVWRNF